jgi:hypothetical protein
VPRLPKWVPLNPGCGCLLLAAIAFAALLLWSDTHQ